MHAVDAEDVRDLVRIGHDGRRPEREHEARELVDEELDRLEVHVSVDEARDDEPARRVDHLVAVVRAETGDHTVGDGDIAVEPFPGEHRQHPAASDDEVGGLVAAGNRDRSFK